MSVTSMNSRMAMAEKLSIPQLQQAIKAGSVPAYVGIPLLQEKMKLQKAMQAQMGQEPQPEGTIADQIMQEADAEGITGLPSNLPLYDTEEMYGEMGEDREGQEYARGGIIALAGGGTGEEGPQPKSLPTTTYLYDAKPFKEDPAYRAFVQDGGLNGDLRYDTFLELGNPRVSSQFERPVPEGGYLETKADRDIYAQDIADKAAVAKAGEEILAAGKDVGSIALKGLGTPTDYLTRGLRAIGVPEFLAPRVPAEFTFNRSEESLTPYTDKLISQRAQQVGEVEEPGGKAVTIPENISEMEEPGGPAATVGIPKTAPAGGKPGAQAPAATGRGQAPSGGISSLPASKGGTGAPATLKAAEKAAEGNTSQAAPASQALSMLDKYVAMLEKSGQDVDRDKKEALYMALIQGGLAAAGGTSPNALANISAGMVPAMQGYQQAVAGIKKDERARLEKLLSAGLKKEEFLLQAKKLGIEERKAEAMANYYNARAATAGTGGDAAAAKQARLFAFNAGRDLSRVEGDVAKLKNSEEYKEATRILNMPFDPKKPNPQIKQMRERAQSVVNSVNQEAARRIADARGAVDFYRSEAGLPPLYSGGSGGGAGGGFNVGQTYIDKQGNKAVYRGKDASGKDIWE